ncbi:hypothetical protein Tco_1464795 [Tanacetum coccineum]
MRLAKKVKGTVEASESFRGKLVKTMREEASCCRTSCIYQGEERSRTHLRWDRWPSIEVRTYGIERLLGLHLLMKERSPYTKIEEVRMKASQCEEGCFKAIEGNAKEYQIRGMELAVVVLN